MKLSMKRLAMTGLVAACLALLLLLAGQPPATQAHFVTRVGQEGAGPLPIDTLIERKVEFIQQNLQPGMSKAEVVRLLGDGYRIVDDRGDLEDGSDSFWKYRFFVQPGYISSTPDYVVDEEGASARKVGVDLFLGWKQDHLYLYSITYPQGDHVYFYLMYPDGTADEEMLR